MDQVSQEPTNSYPTERSEMSDGLLPKLKSERSQQSYLKEYEIHLRFLSRGMIIRVGCKEIPFTSIEAGMKALHNYIDSPPVEGRKWLAILD
jgi:hypothetical protein